jgi:PBP1b-binding outer membrane lipoprotein LpoB
MRRRFTRGTCIVALGTIALYVMAAGCSSEPTQEAEPEVATMELTVGSQTITVADDGTVTGGPIDLSGTENVSARWLKADGTVDAIASDGEKFQMNVEPSNTSMVTFARTSSFVGTLTAVSAGSTQIEFSLFHIAEGHEDFGPFPVPTTVQ